MNAKPQYNIKGEHTGTGVFDTNQVWFYNTYFNTSEYYSKYDPDALLRSFNAGSPSLIRGQGHAWVLDGYVIAQKAASSRAASRYLVQIYDVYWHANLGWNGSANGYYKLKLDTHVEFESGGYRFTTEDLSTCPGLYKKTNNYNY